MNESKKKAIKDYVLYSAIIIVGIVLDQITKLVAIKHLKDVYTVPFIEDFIHFTYLENDGAAFGMLDDHRWIFMVVSVIAIVAIGAFLYMRRSPNLLYAIAMAMIVSGGIGNMIDRIAYGYVVDFIDPVFISFAIFNVADCFVTVGSFGLIILLVIDIIKEGRRELRKKNGNDGDKA